MSARHSLTGSTFASNGGWRFCALPAIPIGPGALVALLGGLAAWWGFMPPELSFSLARYGDKVTLVTFAFVSVVVVCAADYFRRLTKRLDDEEHLRQLAVQELAHRLKNKIATIQAIISVQLREQPQMRNDILDRLQALSAIPTTSSRKPTAGVPSCGTSPKPSSARTWRRGYRSRARTFFFLPSTP